MHDIVRVNKGSSFENLPYYFLGLNEFNSASVLAIAFKFLKDCPIELLEHQKDTPVISENFNKVDDVIMLQLFQDSYFLKRCFSDLKKVFSFFNLNNIAKN